MHFILKLQKSLYPAFKTIKRGDRSALDSLLLCFHFLTDTHFPGWQQSRGTLFTGVCLSVCLSVYPHDISKTDAARTIKLDAVMFRNESWKPICFGVKRSQITKNNAGMGRCTLVSAGLFLFFIAVSLCAISVAHMSHIVSIKKNSIEINI